MRSLILNRRRHSGGIFPENKFIAVILPACKTKCSAVETWGTAAGTHLMGLTGRKAEEIQPFQIVEPLEAGLIRHQEFL